MYIQQATNYKLKKFSQTNLFIYLALFFIIFIAHEMSKSIANSWDRPFWIIVTRCGVLKSHVNHRPLCVSMLTKSKLIWIWSPK